MIRIGGRQPICNAVEWNIQKQQKYFSIGFQTNAFIIHPLLSRFFDITAIQDVQC